MISSSLLHYLGKFDSWSSLTVRWKGDSIHSWLASAHWDCGSYHFILIWIHTRSIPPSGSVFLMWSLFGSLFAVIRRMWNLQFSRYSCHVILLTAEAFLISSFLSPSFEVTFSLQAETCRGPIICGGAASWNQLKPAGTVLTALCGCVERSGWR